jgi:hypothetical protein
MSASSLRALRALPVCAALTAVLCALPGHAQAQDLKLPRPSHGAKVSATVGVTEVTVDYSAPAVKGRAIWGALLPHGQVWRAGANQTTKLTLSTDAQVGGKPVAAGTYGVFVIPSPTAYTFILSKDAGASEQSYREASDVLRVQVMPQAVPARERLAYQVLDATDEGATLALEWEKVRLAVPLKVDTQALVLAQIKALKGDDARPYNNAARWLLEHKLEAPLALELVNKSIALKEDWQSQWTRAELLFAKGDKAGARAAAARADELGKKTPDNFFWADRVTKALAEWK